MIKKSVIIRILKYVGIIAGSVYIILGLFLLIYRKSSLSVPTTALGLILLEWLLPQVFLKKIIRTTSILFAIAVLYLLFTGYWTSRI